VNREEFMNEVKDKGLITADVLKFLVEDKVSTYNELQKWSPEDYQNYNKLLEHLKLLHGEGSKKTGDKGKALESLVNFIINKTYFFEVHENIRTGTNEIDQLIRLSDRGKQALYNFEISRDLLHINDDVFLGECKNYKESLTVTYVGKFYGLLKSCDCNFGIIFSVKGLSGKEHLWGDSYGLVKVLRLIEKYKHEQDFYILEFNINDYEKISQGVKFLDLIKEKKTALQVSADHRHLINEDFNSEEEEVIRIMKSLQTK
jgi:hypothetical protein